MIGKQSVFSILRRVLRPFDFAIALVYIGLFSLFLVFSLENLGEAGSVVIQSQGQEYRYSIDEQQLIRFEGPVGETVVEINGEGQARFVYSDCRDQICVNNGPLRSGGDWAACLPNRVIVRLDVSSGDDGIDATAF